MASRNQSCHSCKSSNTYPFNTRFRPGTVVITEEKYRCRNCNEVTTVQYNR